MAGKRTAYRSAVTGRFVKPAKAKQSPRTTVKETIKKKGK